MRFFEAWINSALQSNARCGLCQDVIGGHTAWNCGPKRVLKRVLWGRSHAFESCLSPTTSGREAKALQYLHLGYQRLLAFEVSGGGSDWFGHGPANRTLTAYGLSELREVDPEISGDSGSSDVT